MIELHHITKRFGPLLALDDISLQLHPARIHGLLGENGAGKSTLMNVLFGLLSPDAGHISIDNKTARIPSPRTAHSLGIGMVHQHFKLVPSLNVLQNIALSLRTSVRRIRKPAEAQFAQLAWSIPLATRIEDLSVGQQQRVEIAKALLAITRSNTKNRTLILDEPTAVLTPQETTELFAAVTALKESNTAVIFITHKLAEVQRVCDTITILRRGQHILTAPANALTSAEMSEKMVGMPVQLPTLRRPTSPLPNTSATPTTTPPILALDNLSAGKLRNASLHIAPGEILGIAGVDGNGQSDLVAAIVGTLPLSAGKITLNAEDATTRPIRWRLDRLAYIAEDRHRQAVVLPLSLQDNLLLKEYRTPPYSRAGLLRLAPWRSHARDLVQRFDIRTPSIAATVGTLSGGNQQKVVLARELHDLTKPLVLAVNPTRGLDVGATAFVMRQLLAARNRGAALLLIHSDLDELLALSDRLAVLYNGTLTPTGWPNCTKDQIGQLMLGL